MTEVADPVSDFLIGDMEHNKDTCYFCKAVPKQTGTNSTIANHEADTYGYEGPLDNDAGKLGDNLGGKPARKDLNFTSKTGHLPSAVAAHHLIPGNASLAKSQFLKQKKYLHVEGSADGNIGYDVNNAENGIWTPGCYAMYTPTKGKEGENDYVAAIKGWGATMALLKKDTNSSVAYVSQQEYADACILKWGVQFHDSHPKYSGKIISALDAVFVKLEAGANIICPEATRRSPPEYTLYSLLARLNNILTRSKVYVELTSIARWADDMYLSDRSKDYHIRNRPAL